MKSPFKICEEIVRQIKNDADIVTYCKANFGRELMFQIGFDPNEEPGIEDTPFLVIAPYNFAPSRDRASRSMLFKACLVARAEPYTTGSDYNYCPTTDKFFALYELIEDSLSGWGNENYVNSYAFPENSFDIKLPFIRTFFSFSIQEDF
jgi:hypothetical protein